MITLEQLLQYINQLLEIEKFSDYGPNGLQVEGKKTVKKLITAVSATLETIEKAADEKADVLLVHHGLFWSGDSYPITGAKKEKIQKLLQNEISLLAYHLPLDAHPQFGNNWKAAKDMGWDNLEPFGLFKGSFIGVKGKIKPISREHFQTQLETYYQNKALVSLGGKKEIETVALISGGAYKQITEAAECQMDCFITGNVDEPAWYLAQENKINFFALGHSATEKVGPKAIGEHLKEKFQIEHQFLDIYNPF